MNKFIMMFVVLIALVMSSCLNTKQMAHDAANAALNAAQDFGERYSEKRNAAELAAAIIEGKAIGLTIDDIDKDQDGVYSASEATSFELKMIKDQLGDKAKEALSRLTQGDVEGAKSIANDLGPGAWQMIKDALLAIMAAGGTGAVVLRKHRRATIDETHRERDDKRLVRGEPTGTDKA